MIHTILISGAGVAGATLAHQLTGLGFQVTVVERAERQRSSGSPVDVKGPAVDVVRRMGLLPQLRAAASAVDRIAFVDNSGRRRAALSLRAFGAGDQFELPRADLAGILLSAAQQRTQVRWGDCITALSPGTDGVDVEFECGAPEHFDLVIGVDGVHSAVRRLAFGPESEFARHMGMYVATVAVDEPLGDAHEVILYNQPGRALSIHPNRGKAVAAFIFRHSGVPRLDHRDLETHKRLVADAYSGALGVFAPYLDHLRAADDVYFDSVSRIQLPHWSSGRIALVGDAAAGLSLFGDGTTLAIAGADTLATELADNPTDPAAALIRYEQRHRVVVEPRLRGLRAARLLMVPGSRTAITLRDTAVRLFGRFSTDADQRAVRVARRIADNGSA